ncbi:MAG: outer membrane beta-barrel protein [Gammaproteobacteria bacterium]|nr:outer membrane beta-barrel protein [Gammaproteobacteria bacterium]
MATHTLRVIALALTTSLTFSHYAHADVLSGPTSARSAKSTAAASSSNFNPAISLILDGRYVATDLDELELPGFQTNGAEAPEDGFGLGETELSISANIDDKVFGWFTLSLEEEDGETQTEIEEAYIESIGLGNGLSLRGGRFFSYLGYENAVHDHALDFTDRSLIHSALFGGNFAGDGIQARWIAPTDLFLELGVELANGNNFPGGDNDSSIGSTVAFARTGGDFGVSHAWRLGASYLSTSFDNRPNAEQEASESFALRNGDADILGVDLVYKWSPRGNPTQRNFKLVAEYFRRDENGIAELSQGANSGSANYDGSQDGFYIQGLYQWQPSWRAGIRFDHISSDNSLRNITGAIAASDFIAASGLISDEDPRRVTASVDYSPSEFSRFRLQYSQTDTGEIDEDTIILQYIVSLGAHPAHSF